MENNAKHIAPTCFERTDPVPHRGPDVSAFPLDRPFMNGEDKKVAQIRIKGDHLGLLARPVFDKHEFTALKLLSFPAEHDHGLKGKERRAIDIPMQTIEISAVIPKQQGSGLGLPLEATFFLKGRKG